jgi:hypothetical protein
MNFLPSGKHLQLAEYLQLTAIILTTRCVLARPLKGARQPTVRSPAQGRASTKEDHSMRSISLLSAGSRSLLGASALLALASFSSGCSDSHSVALDYADGGDDGGTGQPDGSTGSDAGDGDGDSGATRDAGGDSAVPVTDSGLDASADDAGGDSGGGGDGDDAGNPVLDDAGLPTSGPEPVFSYAFETRIPVELDFGSGTRTLTEGYGTFTGSRFGEYFLRSATGNTVTLTLEYLPMHTSMTIYFTLAAIDGLGGGNGAASSDRFKVEVDGNEVFSQTFANGTNSASQSYVPAPGVTMQRNQALGFNATITDSAYDFYKEPDFRNLPHTSADAVITFSMEGTGTPAIDDESWAIDNIWITVSGLPKTQP